MASKRDIIQWYGVDGLTMEQTARKAKCHNRHVSRIVTEAGIKRNSGVYVSDQQKAKAARYYAEEEVSATTAARKFGMSLGTFSKYMHKHGLMRSPSAAARIREPNLKHLDPVIGGMREKDKSFAQIATELSVSAGHAWRAHKRNKQREQNEVTHKLNMTQETNKGSREAKG